MGIPWSQIIITALTNSVFTAAALAALAFAGRSLIGRWISRSMERYKAELQAANVRELERLRADLRRASFEHETRFAKLQETWAEIISELYRLLVQTEDSLRSVAFDIELELSDTFSESKAEKVMTARKSVEAFWYYFNEHRLYFAESLCSKIEELNRQFLTTWHKFSFDTFSRQLTELGLPDAFDSEYAKKLKQEKPLSRLTDQIPPIRRDIESEFRKMLGIPNSK
jgi:hypothetical protein